MSELKRKVVSIGIRTDLNMLYTLSRCIATIIELEDESDLVADTLTKLTDSMILTVADLHDEIARSYGAKE